MFLSVVYGGVALGSLLEDKDLLCPADVWEGTRWAAQREAMLCSAGRMQPSRMLRVEGRGESAFLPSLSAPTCAFVQWAEGYGFQ